MTVKMNLRVVCSYVTIVIFTIFCGINGENLEGENGGSRNVPTVMVAILARNKAHTLPYFLTLLEKLDYPKSRISLW